MTENQLDALVNDKLFNARCALISLEQAIAQERKVLDLIAATMADGSHLACAPHPYLSIPTQSAIKIVTELRLLVQLRRQAGRFVDDEGQRSQGSRRTLGSEDNDDLYDGSDY